MLLSLKTLSFRLLLANVVLLTGISVKGASPEVLEVLPGFDRPVSAAFGPEGKSLFVVNRSRGEIGAIRGAGSITKYTVGSDYSFKLASKRFAIGLTAPSDIDFLPVSLGKVAPKGALFLISGTPLIETEDGRITKDASNDFIGLTVLDPLTGKVIKRVSLGPTSPIKLKNEYSLISPVSMTFDGKGSLYIADTGIGGNLFRNPLRAQPVIYRIDKQGVMDLLTGVSPLDVEAMKVSSIPGDICYQPKDDSVYFLTNHNQGAPKGAIFRIGSTDFKNGSMMQTIVRELTALSSMVLSPSGRVLLTTNSGELIYPRGKKSSRTIRFRPQMTFSTPGRFGILTQSDGRLLLAVPEETGDAGINKGQRVKIVLLPAGYN